MLLGVNPSANLLKVEFGAGPSETVAVIYRPEDGADFEQIIALLRARVNNSGSGVG